MAIFRPGSIIGDISGALGGFIAKRSSGSRVLSRRSSHIRSRSLAITAARANFQTLIVEWSLLAPAVQQAWRVASRTLLFRNRLGIPRHISGQSLFIRHYMPLRVAGSTSPLGLPPTVSADPLTSLTMSFVTAGPYTVTYSTPPGPPFTDYIVYGASWYTSRPRTFIKDYRIIALVPGLSTGTNLISFWQLVFPPLRVGMTASVRVCRHAASVWPSPMAEVRQTLTV